MEVNKYQTPLTDEVLSQLSKEEYEQLFDYINNIPFIQSLISPDRKRARDLPRHNNKIIVDVCHPHILEDMEYFRPAGNYYKQHGCFTKLRPNGNPNSEFGKWFKTELNRIWNGYVRPSDGEWVTGDFYFYINYCPIMISRIKDNNKKVAYRVNDFPEIWEGNYLWFHYIDQARNGGLYNDFTGGQHAVLIARRGVGKSFSAGALLAKLFTCGENEETTREVTGLVTAYEKEYLTKDGILNKFVNMADFCAENTQFPSARYKNSLAEMDWIMGYQDVNTGILKGTKNEIIGFSSKDNPDKGRGKRAHKLIFEEFGRFPQFLNTWNTSIYNVKEGDFAFGQMIAFGCVCKDTKVYTNKGKLINIQDIQEEDGILGFKNNEANKEPITYIQPYCEKETVQIKSTYNNIQCSVDHPILCKVPKRSTKHNKRWLETKWVQAKDIKKGYYIAHIVKIDVWGTTELKDAYLIGALIGDGNYGVNKTPVLSNCDIDLLNYVKNNYSTTVETSYITKDNKTYEELRIKNICPLLKDLKIYGQTKSNKKLPINYQSLDKESSLNLLAGLIDTDGYIGKRVAISQCSKDLLEELQFILRKLGIFSKIYKIKSSKFSSYTDRTSNTFLYRLEISEKRSLQNFAESLLPYLKIKYKKEATLKFLNRVHIKENIIWRTVTSAPVFTGIQQIYNLTANDSHTYIANGIITHNTGGTTGSDFSGALELIYHPEGYGVYAIPNVFDKNSQGKSKSVFFLGAYMNRKGYYNKDGVSDVIGALISEIKERTQIKYNSSDVMALTQRKAEMAITIQEAIMKRDNTIYPVADLNDRLNEIDFNPHYFDDLWIGSLSLKDGNVVYTPNTEVEYIKNFPHKDNKLEGAICIKAMPEKDSSGRVPYGRYIAGIDPYDDDVSNTMSLGALYILDLFTDELVFEYVGRPTFADDFYEICRKALLFYNAECNYENNKKGLFKYFSQHNCLYLLSDTLDFLKDKELIRGNLYGNKAKGVNATESIKAYARRCIRDWLLKPIENIKELDNGEIEETTSLNLFKIPFRALIQELSTWNSDGNFDRHDALGMLMLLREDKLRLIGESNIEDTLKEDPNYLGNDPFFQSKKLLKFTY